MEMKIIRRIEMKESHGIEPIEKAFHLNLITPTTRVSNLQYFLRKTLKKKKYTHR
jgi:hypothetical protein